MSEESEVTYGSRLTEAVIINREQLKIIFSTAIEKRATDEMMNGLPEDTRLLKEMKNNLDQIRKGKHVIII
jgi:hypothetical protein